MDDEITAETAAEKRTAKLTKRVIDAAQYESTRYVIWDKDIPGYGLLLRPTHTKSYIFRYRNASGRDRQAVLAKVGALTPDAARNMAKDYAEKVRLGGDPLADKITARNALKVGDMLDAYLESERFLNEKEPSTQRTDKGRINGHLRPLLGTYHAHEVQSEDVRRMFREISEGKTAKKAVKLGPRAVSRFRGGAGAARKCVRLLAAIYKWAIKEKKLTSTENPAHGIEIGSDGERVIYLEPEDYKRLFETLDAMEADGRLRSVLADLYRCYALTGARQSELLRCCCRNVEMDLRRIVLPKHKTGKKTGAPRIITLNTAAQEIIARRATGGPDDLVFQPAMGKGRLSPRKDWLKVRAEAKLPNYADGKPIGFHGLRHGFGSCLAEDGGEAPEIMTVLGHKQMSTTAKYIHFRDSARLALAERAAGGALAGMAAARGKPKASVTPLKRNRKA